MCKQIRIVGVHVLSSAEYEFLTFFPGVSLIVWGQQTIGCDPSNEHISRLLRKLRFLSRLFISDLQLAAGMHLKFGFCPSPCWHTLPKSIKLFSSIYKL